MRSLTLLLPKNKALITKQIVLLLNAGLIFLSLHSTYYYLLLLPLLIGGVVIIIFLAEIIPFLLILTNFYGGFIFLKSKIAVTITDIFFFLVVIAFCGYHLKKKGSISTSLEDISIVGWLFLFFFVSLISLSLNVSNLNSKYILVGIWYLLKLVQLPLGFFIFSKCCFSSTERENLINLCILLSLLQLPVVLWQLFRASGESILQYRNEVTGTLTYHHSMLGTFMLIAIALCLYKYTKAYTIVKKILFLILASVFLFIMILSGSRSPLFGLTVSAILFFFCHFRFRYIHFLYVIPFILGLLLFFYLTPLGDVIYSTFNAQETQLLDLSSFSRFIIWEGALDHFVSANILHKLFGVGIGAYPTIQYDLVIWGYGKTIAGAHNNLLHVLCEIGIVGLFVFIAIFYKILKTLLDAYNDPLSKAYFYLTIALIASSITQETFWFQKAFGSFWLFYTLLLALVLPHNQRIRQ